LLKYFSVLVFSEDVGRGKPHPSIFLEACRLADQDPAQCVHVGDDITADVEASYSLGMKPVWLDRMGVTACPVPTTRITSLRELRSSDLFAFKGPSLPKGIIHAS